MKGRGKRTGYREWSVAEIAKLRAIYPNSPTRHVGEFLGRTKSSINAAAAKLGLHKSAAYLAGPFKRLLSGLGNGIRHRVPKGHVPANKGLRRPGWFRGRMRQTWFKKGQRPYTWKPLGSTRLMDGYLQRKVTDTGYPPRDWRPLHHLLWQKHRGRIPRGHVLRFKDGNKQNIRLSNLELITRRENRLRNCFYRRYPPDLKRAVYALITLKRAITMRSKANG
jgi:hypothetical protein